MKELLRPYDPNWHKEFLQLKKILETVFSDVKIKIEHVGSTSIPGLISKPILDIDIIIDDRELLTICSNKLEKLGYINRGDQGIPGRVAFRQSTPNTPNSRSHNKWMSHHLYVCMTDSLALKNHLLFRNTLLLDSELVAQYSKLKKDLSEEPEMTREKYGIRKTQFILKVLEIAGLGSEDLDAIKESNR